MEVTILGPGLGDIPQGDCQVHAATCPDLNRGHYRRVPKKLRRTVDVVSMQEVMELVFPPAEVGWDPDDLSDYSHQRDRIGWYPCVRGRLRARRPTAVEQMAAWLVTQPHYDLPAVLLAFSEWLDSEYGANFPDNLTHDDVVERFLEFYTQKEEA